MRKMLLRLLGVFLILGAIFGFLVAATGLVSVWRLRPEAATVIKENTALLSRSLETTSSLLDVLDGSLIDASTSLNSLEAATNDLSATLLSVKGATGAVAVLAGDDLVTVIDQTRVSLDSAQASARLIDDTLKIVSSIPLIGARYEPEKSLETSLGEISASLEPVPGRLELLQSELETTAANLETMKSDVDDLSTDLGTMRSSLKDARQAVKEYQSIVIDLQTRVDGFLGSVDGWLTILVWSLTAFMVWLLIAQAGLLAQGILYLGIR